MGTDELMTEIKRLHDRAKVRYHELGVVDGLLLAQRMLRDRGDHVGAQELAVRAEGLLRRLEAEIDAATLMDRVANLRD